MRRVIAVAGVAFIAPPMTAGATTPPNSEPGTAYDLAAPISADAISHCTDVLNQHLDRRTEADEVFMRVLEASSNDESPSTATIAEWSDLLAGDIARADSIRADLAAFEVTDAAATELWELVVAAADQGGEALRTRAAALATGDWAAVVAAFASTLGESGGISPDAHEAIESSPLRGTDCAAVHTWRMPDDENVTAEFVTAVTQACVAITTRRLPSTFDADYETSLNFLAALLSDTDPDVPSDLEPALGRIVHEWEATVADLDDVEPTLAPSAEAWNAILAVPSSRLAMYEGRRDAVAGGDQGAITAAYNRSLVSPAAWEWENVGLDGRVCSGLRH